MGTLEAPEDLTRWTDKSRWITFSGVDNLVVQGGGVLDGNGKIWWQNSCKINKSAVRIFFSFLKIQFFVSILIIN